ncbi:VOC family protein [uncultured Hydrogenophaga sp.]|uniref:VOC family protein n=1 Tax=uncultured Hydrogenophaga sp. TaxID=199683 RepID=UPI00265EA1B4|nr:VOC family protein [uncultured Hydrogenophaga sp.]
MSIQLDHLVVGAASLEQGVAWCESVLGVSPAAGGAHALFGTHNRLLRLAGAPDAYLEVIAIDPAATPVRQPPLKRWFDLDDPELQESLRRHGPQLIHWVARVPDIGAAVTVLAREGWERGPVLEASRPTAQGLLSWRITVRDDGRRLGLGALPTLIEWGATHPAGSLPDAGLGLKELCLGGPHGAAVKAALDPLGTLPACRLDGDARSPALTAEISTPRGMVVLNCPAVRR